MQSHILKNWKKRHQTVSLQFIIPSVVNFLQKIFCNISLCYLVTSDGRISHTEVTTFLRKQPTVINKYLSITTTANRTISLTGNHLIYARNSLSHKFNPV